jgi:DNA-binding beta-propeller fold protein YncE
LTPDGWELAARSGELAIVNTDSSKHGLTAAFGIPIRIAITPDGRNALVTCAGTAEIVAFDVATRSELARRKVDVPRAPGAERRSLARLAPDSVLPIGLLVSGDGTSAFVAATMGDVVVQVGTRTLEPLRTIDVGGEPDGLAVTRCCPGTLPRLPA